MRFVKVCMLFTSVSMVFCFVMGCSKPNKQSVVIHDDLSTQDADLYFDVDEKEVDIVEISDTAEQDVVLMSDSSQPIDYDPSPIYERIPFDPDYWKQPNDCYETIAYPPGEEFFIPENTSRQPWYLRRSDIIQRFGSVPDRAIGRSTSNAHHSTFGNIFAARGEDVVVHLFGENRQPDELIANLAVVLDFKPVEARLVRWEPERAHILQEVIGSGMRFEVEHDVEVLDIIIPASQFPEDRAYDLSISYKDQKSLSGNTGYHRRFIVYYNGFQRPSHPCFEPALELTKLTDVELDLFRSAAPSLLFAEHLTTREQLANPIRAERGQRIELLFSLLTTPVRPRPVVAVPVMNGEPVGEFWYLSVGGKPSYSDRRPVDARKSFEIVLPEEPGIYDVHVPYWDDPFQPYADLEGNRISGVMTGGGSFSGTNILRFIVE